MTSSPVLRALWATPCCGRVVALLLGPDASLPCEWHGAPCYCGKTYAVNLDDPARFENYGDALPPDYPSSSHWWALTETPLLARPVCSVAECRRASVAICRFYTETGPEDIACCKVHIQRIGAVIDGLIQAAIHDPT